MSLFFKLKDNKMKKIEKLIIPDKTCNAYYMNNPSNFDTLFNLVANNLKSYTIKLRSRNYFTLLLWIYSQTEILNQINATLKTRIYWIFNNIHDFPKCKNKNCKNKLHEVQNISDGYNKGYCSNHCAQTDLDNILKRHKSFEQIHGKGITCPQKLLDVREKIRQSQLNMSEDKKQKKLKLFKQAWKNKSTEQIQQITMKRKQTSLYKYGVEVPSQTICARKHMSKVMSSDIVQHKIIETRRKNKTTNKSKMEDLSYDYLCLIFSTDDIIRQYRSKKYPFNCDFYIKSKDLYIECNYNWTHGKHFFDPSNKDDIKQIEKWKAKNTKYYTTAIDVWTRRDKLKLQTAIDNKLNYIVFWKIQELYDWINNQYNINDKH